MCVCEDNGKKKENTGKQQPKIISQSISRSQNQKHQTAKQMENTSTSKTLATHKKEDNKHSHRIKRFLKSK